MRIRCLAFIATSLDGYIARADGSLDWLPAPAASGEDYGYAEFMSQVDALVMGRKTFETVLGFGDWPYAGKRVVVLSHTRDTGSLPVAFRGKVEFHSGALPELLGKLEALGYRGVYVDGGRTIRGFLEAGLLDELVITRIPLLLGCGIPLFGETRRDIALQHLATRSYPDGLVQSRYRVIR